MTKREFKKPNSNFSQSSSTSRYIIEKTRSNSSSCSTRKFVRTPNGRLHPSFMANSKASLISMSHPSQIWSMFWFEYRSLRYPISNVFTASTNANACSPVTCSIWENEWEVVNEGWPTVVRDRLIDLQGPQDGRAHWSEQVPPTWPRHRLDNK